MNGDDFRRLVVAHVQKDGTEFRSVVAEVASKERRLSHHTLANELDRLVATNGDSPRATSPPVGVSNGTPKDRERNVALIELIEPNRDLESLVLDPQIRQQLDRIVEEWRRAEVLRSHGLQPISKVLFCGPPGCGKTVTAEALAKELYLPLALVRFDAVVSSYLGETAANLRKVFDFARTRPVVLLFDEFDAIGKDRESEDEHGELKRVVNSFLQLLDGFRSNTLTIAATNHQGLLDSALWRRFDEIVQFPLPTPDEIEQLLCRQFQQITVNAGVRLGATASQLEGLSQADVERVAIDAIKQTLLSDRREIDAGTLTVAVARQTARGESVEARRHPSTTTKPSRPKSPQQSKDRNAASSKR